MTEPLCDLKKIKESGVFSIILHQMIVNVKKNLQLSVLTSFQKNDFPTILLILFLFFVFWNYLWSTFLTTFQLKSTLFCCQLKPLNISARYWDIFDLVSVNAVFSKYASFFDPTQCVLKWLKNFLLKKKQQFHPLIRNVTNLVFTKLKTQCFQMI